MKRTPIFPEDFRKVKHYLYTKGGYQWLFGNEPKVISILGGTQGICGDGKTTFEMMHPAMKGDLKGWMTKDEINEYLAAHPL